MSRHRTRRPAPFRTDRRGATLIEFALICPVMLLLIMGLCDLMYQAYVQAILTGAVQKAARDATIEHSTPDALDARVVSAIKNVAANATWQSTRKTYSQFGYVAPEPFNDDNSNGKRDPGECFSDINNNKVWDADPGITGQGGANDVTVYTMQITYPRLFPVSGMLGWSSNNTISAKTVLKNQPYGLQSTSTPPSVCT